MDAYINELKNGRVLRNGDEVLNIPPTRATLWAAKMLDTLNLRVHASERLYNELMIERDALIDENERLIKLLKDTQNAEETTKPA